MVKIYNKTNSTVKQELLMDIFNLSAAMINMLIRRYANLIMPKAVIIRKLISAFA